MKINDAGEVLELEDGVSGLTTPVLGANTDELIRCPCGTLLAEYASRPWRFKCRKCKSTLSSGPARVG
jgi:ribosomal protein S27AE